MLTSQWSTEERSNLLAYFYAQYASSAQPGVLPSEYVMMAMMLYMVVHYGPETYHRLSQNAVSSSHNSKEEQFRLR